MFKHQRCSPPSVQYPASAYDTSAFELMGSMGLSSTTKLIDSFSSRPSHYDLIKVPTTMQRSFIQIFAHPNIPAFPRVVACSVVAGSCDEHEYRLTKHLLDGYDAGVRPAKNSSQPLVVVFGVSLHHIIDVVSRKYPYSLPRFPFWLVC